MVLVKSILVQMFSLIISASSCLIILSSPPTIWSITFEPGTQYCVANIFSCIFSLFIELNSNSTALEKIFHGRYYSSPPLSNQSHAYHTPEITWSKEVSLAPHALCYFSGPRLSLHYAILSIAWDSCQPIQWLPLYAEATYWLQSTSLGLFSAHP